MGGKVITLDSDEDVAPEEPPEKRHCTLMDPLVYMQSRPSSGVWRRPSLFGTQIEANIEQHHDYQCWVQRCDEFIKAQAQMKAQL